MDSNTDKMYAVPTNIITGFLGVGKTSAIMHLMQQKPDNERWAVLVNEFGEIGVDGSLFQGKQNEEQGVFIKEVPGGCMCCTAGLPMQIALNQLLAKAKPDRLLIEPTGLGHPAEVLEALSSAHYQQVLSMQKTLTLVDARKISDERYTNHETFNQQIAIADTVIGNKLDLYKSGHKDELIAYVKQHGQPHTVVEFCEYGRLSLTQLEGPTESYPMAADHHHHHASEKTLALDLPMPETGFIKATNQGEGFRSVGWRFSAEKEFNRQKLLSFLTGLEVERMKAVFITDDGIFGYNLTEDALTEMYLDECQESRIEMIARQFNESLEQDLMGCLID